MHFSGLTLRDVASIQIEAREFRAKERYQSFESLAREEREGQSFTRTVQRRQSPFAIVAPHGGNLECGTSEIAKLIAGEEFSLYSFESLKPHGDNSLRITSVRFDDPRCLELCAAAETVISVHGCFGAYKAAFIGGADAELRDRIVTRIKDAGINSSMDLIFEGLHQENICNRGSSKRGVQLELTAGLRQELQVPFDEAGIGAPPVLKLVEAVRSVLLEMRKPEVSSSAEPEADASRYSHQSYR